MARELKGRNHLLIELVRRSVSVSSDGKGFRAVYDVDGLALRRIPVSVYHFERSEEHTSELQSPDHLVCRLLLEKKKKDALYVKSKSSSNIHNQDVRARHY